MTYRVLVSHRSTRREEKQRVKRTNLVNQELKLDDSSAAVVLTVALHACSAKAEGHFSQGIYKHTWQENAGKKHLVFLM